LHEVVERLAAGHASRVVEEDFALRAKTFALATADPAAFWNGDIIPEPTDWKTYKGRPYGYWAHLSEDPETPLKVGIRYEAHQAHCRVARR
jgi:hypothetical protein